MGEAEKEEGCRRRPGIESSITCTKESFDSTARGKH